MSTQREPPLRRLRLAAAYALFVVPALPGIAVFFYVKDVMPDWLVHPDRQIWIIFVCRLALQILASLAVLFPLLATYFYWASRFLSEPELRELRKKLAV